MVNRKWKGKMGRQEELKALKARTRTLENRLHRLRQRIKAMEHQGLRPSLLRAVVDAEKCLGCGLCEAACPVGAVWVDETAHVDPERCIGCGRCVDQCPQGAVSLGSTDRNHRRQAAGKGGMGFEKQDFRSTARP